MGQILLAKMDTTNVLPFTIDDLEQHINTNGEVLHGFHPYRWQNLAVQHLLEKGAMSHVEPSSPVVVVRSTGEVNQPSVKSLAS